MTNSPTALKNWYESLSGRNLPCRWSIYIPLSIVLIYLLSFTFISSLAKAQNGILLILISPQVFFLLAIITVSIIFRITPGELGFSTKNLKLNLAKGFIASLIPPALVIMVLVPLALYSFIDSGEITFLDASNLKGFPFSWIYLVKLLILAPLFEELFFRGFLIPPLKRIMPLWAVVVTAALIFMFAHGYPKPGAFLLGIFTTIIFIRTGSVIPTIIFHFSCNLWGPVLILFFPGIYRFLEFLFK